MSEKTPLLVNAREAASMLALPLRSVYDLVASRQLPCVRLSERRIRFRPSDLRRFIDEHVEVDE